MRGRVNIQQNNCVRRSPELHARASPLSICPNGCRTCVTALVLLGSMMAGRESQIYSVYETNHKRTPFCGAANSSFLSGKITQSWPADGLLEYVHFTAVCGLALQLKRFLSRWVGWVVGYSSFSLNRRLLRGGRKHPEIE